EVWKMQRECFQNVINGDRVLSVLMAQYGKIKYLDFVSGVYRRGSGSFSSQSRRYQHNSRLITYRSLKKVLTEQDSLVIINTEINCAYTDLIYYSLLHFKLKSAIEYNQMRKSELNGMRIKNFLSGFFFYS